MQLFTPEQYLQIDIANSFGLAKQTWDTRLNWFQQNQDNLYNLIQEADEPAMFFAGIQAWENHTAGNAIGYPISLDATASGMQLLSVMICDRNAAALCNVIDTNDRRDAYQVIYDIMLQQLPDSNSIKIENVKQAIMTSLYGSQAIPREVFGNGAMFDLFETTMSNYASGIWELNKLFLDIWNPEALSYEWTLPDNFHVKTKITNTAYETVHFMNSPVIVPVKVNAPTESGRSLGANVTHSLDGYIVRELTRRCDYNKHKVNKVKDLLNNNGDGAVWNCTDEHSEMCFTLWNQYLNTGILSARILDYINPITKLHVDNKLILNLIDSLPEKPFKILSVHDCFRVHPNYGNDLRKQYARQLYEIAKSTILDSILTSLLGKQIVTSKLDVNLAEDILLTNYSLS